MPKPKLSEPTKAVVGKIRIPTTNMPVVSSDIMPICFPGIGGGPWGASPLETRRKASPLYLLPLTNRTGDVLVSSRCHTQPPYVTQILRDEYPSLIDISCHSYFRQYAVFLASLQQPGRQICNPCSCSPEVVIIATLRLNEVVQPQTEEEDSTMKCMITLHFDMQHSQEISARLQQEQEHVRALISKGTLKTIYISAERNVIWVVLKGKSWSKYSRNSPHFRSIPTCSRNSRRSCNGMLMNLDERACSDAIRISVEALIPYVLNMRYRSG